MKAFNWFYTTADALVIDRKLYDVLVTLPKGSEEYQIVWNARQHMRDLFPGFWGYAPPIYYKTSLHEVRNA